MQAKCTNFGNCTKADNNEIIDLPAGSDLACPICKRPLTPINTGSRARTPIVPILIGLLLLVGAGLLAKNFFGPKAPPSQIGSGPPGNSANPTPGTQTNGGILPMEELCRTRR